MFRLRQLAVLLALSLAGAAVVAGVSQHPALSFSGRSQLAAAGGATNSFCDYVGAPDQWAKSLCVSATYDISGAVQPGEKLPITLNLQTFGTGFSGNWYMGLWGVILPDGQTPSLSDPWQSYSGTVALGGGSYGPSTYTFTAPSTPGNYKLWITAPLFTTYHYGLDICSLGQDPINSSYLALSCTFIFLLSENELMPIPLTVAGSPTETQTLSISKSEITRSDTACAAPGATVHPGDTICYRLDVANTGSQAASWLTVRDHIPAYTTLAWQGGGMQYNSTGQTAGGANSNSDIWWQEQSAASGWTGYVDFNVKVNSDAPDGTQICNIGRISSQEVAEHNSNTVCNTVSNPSTGPQIPPASASITATCSADGKSASISWAPVSSASAYEPSFWTPESSCPSGWTQSAENATGRSCDINPYHDTSVSVPTTPGTQYAAWVAALSSTGDADWDHMPSTSFTCAAPPPPPPNKTTFSASCDETGAASLAWSNAPAGTTAYRVEIDVPSGESCPSGFQPSSFSASACFNSSYADSHMSTQLSAGKNYSAEVVALDSEGNGTRMGLRQGFACTGAPLKCPDGSPPPGGDIGQCPAGNLPDLTAGAITPGTAVAGVAKTFSATISNIGGASTGSGFPDLFQLGSDWSGNGTRDLGTYNNGALDAGGENVATLSYTFDYAGTYYMRACANKSSASAFGFITESNRANNCGPWSEVIVSSATCLDGSAPPTPGDTSSCTCAQGNTAKCTVLCADGVSPAPGNDPQQCTCQQGNLSACTHILCADGSSPPTPDDRSSCTCQQGNQSRCLPGGAGCTMSASPAVANAGNNVQLSWNSMCATAAEGCTYGGFPEVASDVNLYRCGSSQCVLGQEQWIRSVGSSGTDWVVPSSVPVTYEIKGDLRAGYWPILLPVSETNYACTATITPPECADGSAPVNGECPKKCVIASTSCNADGSIHTTFSGGCPPTDGPPCQFSCVESGNSASCYTPPAPTGTFDINPKLVIQGARSTISWHIGDKTTCAINATNGDHFSGLVGINTEQTGQIFGQTTYTFTCSEDITGATIAPTPITVNVVPTWIEK